MTILCYKMCRKQFLQFTCESFLSTVLQEFDVFVLPAGTVLCLPAKQKHP
jgi:hypothetical protein